MSLVRYQTALSRFFYYSQRVGNISSFGYNFLEPVGVRLRADGSISKILL